MKVSYDKLYESLCYMIEWTLQHQKGYLKFHSSIKDWAKDFATIKFYLPRRSGHTTFAIKLLTEYFTNAVLIVPNIKNIPYQLAERIVTPLSLERLRGMKIDTVIVDRTSSLSNENIELIYSFFENFVKNSRSFCFVLLE